MDSTTYTTPRTITVQLRTGVTVDEFRAAVLPALNDRSDWVRDLQDWDGHPRNRDFRFAVEPHSGPVGAVVPGVDAGTAAKIVVTFGSEADGANWAAFSMGYTSRVCRAVFAAGGSGAASY